MNIFSKIEGKLTRLEVIHAHLEAMDSKPLPCKKNSISRTISQLHEAFKIMQEVKELVQQNEGAVAPDPFVLNLIETTSTEMQECIKVYELFSTGMEKYFAHGKEGKCARDSIFSGILALQLIIAP